MDTPATDLPPAEHDCHCGEAVDISTEQLKLVTDRLDMLNTNIAYIANTLYSVIQNVPRTGVAGMMVRRALNNQDLGQGPNGQ